jgi:AcrR family transcriptional regulator
MTRPRSGDKRNAILAAATDIIAEQGLSAPTAKIARAAGVADGSLFTYFPDKDNLLNQLYVELKADMREKMTSSYPKTGSLKARARHVWDSYIDWGISSPAKRRAMEQLKVSDRITEKSRQAGEAGYGDVQAMMREIVARGALRDQPPTFASAILQALAQVAIDFASRYPKQAKRYQKAGFEAFWRAAVGK